MSERTFRLIAGVLLWVVLWYSAFTGDDALVYVFIGLMAFEGVTNWRISTLVSRLRQGKHYVPSTVDAASVARFGFFEAERVLRLVVAAMLLVTHFYLENVFWFLPWFVTGMLIVSGITNICPMVMAFRYMGFR